MRVAYPWRPVGGVVWSFAALAVVAGAAGPARAEPFGSAARSAVSGERPSPIVPVYMPYVRRNDGWWVPDPGYGRGAPAVRPRDDARQGGDGRQGGEARGRSDRPAARSQGRPRGLRDDASRGTEYTIRGPGASIPALPRGGKREAPEMRVDPTPPDTPDPQERRQPRPALERSIGERWSSRWLGDGDPASRRAVPVLERSQPAAATAAVEAGNARQSGR